MAEQTYAVIGEYIAMYAGRCTCGSGGVFDHEPFCGYEPLFRFTDVPGLAVEADARADERQRIVALAHELGAMYPNPCGDPDCPERQDHYGAFAARIESETSHD